jgi:transcriptional regulator with XRE-family HTH domain
VGFIQHNLLMDDLKKIGLNISRIRKEKEMTQEDLCGLTELDRSHLSEIENGKMNVTVKTLIKISIALDVKLNDII